VTIRLDKRTVESFASLYDAEYDRQIFPPEYLALSHLTRAELGTTGDVYPTRDHLTVEGLQAIMDWKYPRGKTRGFAAKNDPEAVVETTREAFAASDPIDAVSTLYRLHGVGVAMASAILTSFDPLRYTVIDVRAWNALERLGLIEPLGLSGLGDRLGYFETYAAYLRACTQLADDAGVSLRSLDRCLWTLDACRSIMNDTGLYGWARDGVTIDPIVKSPESSAP
jgi:hypothetical protein